ncbi:MAG: NUDIX hydrolase [Proteobacteria bacterium]|nr:NUDIX hydrolase [Pseudomonadota bacterium]
MSELKPKRHAAGVLVFDSEGKMLIGLRGKVSRSPYTWAFPAGSIDPGESSMDAALRELREETGFQGTLKLEKLNTREDDKVVFTSYVAHVDKPFDINPPAHTQWENVQFKWIRPDSPDFPPFSNLHPGFQDIMPDVVRAISQVSQVSFTPREGIDAPPPGHTRVYHGSKFKLGGDSKPFTFGNAGADAYGAGMYGALEPKPAGDYLAKGEYAPFGRWMYTLDFPFTPSECLNSSEMPPADVAARVNAAMAEERTTNGERLTLRLLRPYKDGGELYKVLREQFGKEKTNEILLKAGVKGMYVPDRGFMLAFDPNDIAVVDVAMMAPAVNVEQALREEQFRRLDAAQPPDAVPPYREKFAAIDKKQAEIRKQEEDSDQQHARFKHLVKTHEKQLNPYQGFNKGLVLEGKRRMRRPIATLEATEGELRDALAALKANANAALPPKFKASDDVVMALRMAAGIDDMAAEKKRRSPMFEDDYNDDRPDFGRMAKNFVFSENYVALREKLKAVCGADALAQWEDRIRADMDEKTHFEGHRRLSYEIMTKGFAAVVEEALQSADKQFHKSLDDSYHIFGPRLDYSKIPELLRQYPQEAAKPDNQRRLVELAELAARHHHMRMGCDLLAYVDGQAERDKVVGVMADVLRQGDRGMQLAYDAAEVMKYADKPQYRKVLEDVIIESVDAALREQQKYIKQDPERYDVKQFVGQLVS